MIAMDRSDAVAVLIAVAILALLLSIDGSPGDTDTDTPDPQSQQSPTSRPEGPHLLAREFVDAGGQIVAEAEYLGASDGIARLRQLDDGREFEFEIDRLSADDQEWIVANGLTGTTENSQ